MDKKNSKLLFAAIITIFSAFNSSAHTESSNQTTDKYQLTVSKIAENVFQHVSYKEIKGFGLVPASGLVVINDKDAHIIDTPWTNTDTEQLVTWINSQGFTLKSSISTHFHDDRAGGISYLNKLSIDTYASEFTNKLLASRNKAVAKHSLSLPPPKQKQLMINDTVEVFYPGAGHSMDNIVVWLPEHKILFGGCFVKSLSSTSLGYTGDADIKQWPISMQTLIEQYPQVKIVVPGHGKIGDKKLLTNTKALATEAHNKMNLTQ